jgi:hypothetical protein
MAALRVRGAIHQVDVPRDMPLRLLEINTQCSARHV